MKNEEWRMKKPSQHPAIRAPTELWQRGFWILDFGL
jgi:hypothetical protein